MKLIYPAVIAMSLHIHAFSEAGKDLIAPTPQSFPKSATQMNQEQALFIGSLAAGAYADATLLSEEASTQEPSSLHWIRGTKGFSNNYEDLTTGFIWTLPKKKIIVVSFRGTVDIPDWKSNSKLQFISGSELLSEDFHLHKGFYEAVKESDFQNDLEDAVNDSEVDSNWLFIFTGHSLGGAMASVASTSTKLKYTSPKIWLVTFGSPRVFGNKTSKKVVELLGKNNILRFFKFNDRVSALPPKNPSRLLTGSIGFTHIGHRLEIPAYGWSQWAIGWGQRFAPRKSIRFALELANLTSAHSVAKYMTEAPIALQAWQKDHSITVE